MTIDRRDLIAGGFALGMLCQEPSADFDVDKLIRRAIEAADKLLAALGEKKPWKCMGNVPASDPQDCNYPFCVCSPEATNAVEALKEIGWGPLQALEKRLAIRERQLAVLKEFLMDVSEGYRKGGYGGNTQVDEVRRIFEDMEKGLGE